MAQIAVDMSVTKLDDTAVLEHELLSPDMANSIVELRDKLAFLLAFLRDADQKRRHHHRRHGDSDNASLLDLWVKQARDAAYEAEDAVDDFVVRTEQQLRRWDGACCDIVGIRLRGPTVDAAVRRDLVGRVVGVKKRVEEMIADAKDVHELKSGTASQFTPANSNNGYVSWSSLELSVIEQALVDVDDVNFRRASEFLLDSNKRERCVALAIAGDSGYSRTALARKLYNAVEIKKHFDCRAWVHIHRASTLAGILADIIHQVDTDGWQELELREHLTERRYLFVLDGIPLELWGCLEFVLPDGRNGSRVLLTTVTGSGADMLPYDDYHLYLPSRALNQQMTKELLCRVVWGHGDFVEYYPGRPSADDFFRKTKGIPLAVMFLSGLLRSTPFTQWDEQMDRIPDDGDAVDSILSCSFDELPLRLKPCFIYFAAFADGSAINAQKLVRLWAAEGFLRPQRRGQSTEEAGQEFLKELISRCMIQLVEMDIGENAVVRVGIHGRALAFVQREAEEAGFLHAHDNTDDIVPAHSAARRVSLQNGIDKYVSSVRSAPKLRSLLCDVRTTDVGSFTLHRSRFLRVIDLNGVRLRYLPREIGRMIHLRYLGLAGTGLRRLPLSVRRLINLQTLDVTETDVYSLPASFWRIRALRHVLAGKKLLFVPCTVTVLANLQTLHGARYGSWVHLNGAGLRTMTSLRSLQLWRLPRHASHALLDALVNLEWLTSLDLQGDGLPASVFTVLSLHRLESLTLHGLLHVTPDFEPGNHFILPRLTRLSLSSTNLNPEFVDTVIARLPKLAELVLRRDSYAERALVFPAGGFSALKKLELRELDAVEQWDVEGTLEKLVHVSLSDCSKLRRLPERMPENVVHLQELVLRNMRSIVDRIQEGGEDHHKIRHVGYVRVIS